MRKNLRLTFRKGDLLAVIPVVAMTLMTAVFFLPKNTSSEGAVVQIYQDGELVKELSLDEDQTIRLTGAYSNTVEIRDGKAGITETDCPGADCAHSGWISSMGRSIVCIPNRVEVRIVGEAGEAFAVR